MSSKRHGRAFVPAGWTSDQSISIDNRFDILKNRRRRDVLRHLRERGGESTLSELAELIAATENGTERHLLSSHERKRVYINLYQGHLPKLDSASVVDFDKRSGNVSLRPEADQLLAYLDHEADPTPGEANDENATEQAPLVSRRVRLALGWSLCLLAGLAVAGVPMVPPVGVVGATSAVTFAIVETINTVSVRKIDAERSDIPYLRSE